LPRTRRHALAGLLLLAGIALTSQLSPGLGSDSRPVAGPSAYEPRFEINWFQGALALDGHTLSTDHEALLTLSARLTFPDRPVHTAFRPLGVAPGYWQDVTVQLVELLGNTLSAAATVTGRQVSVRGIVTDTSLGERLASLQSLLPDDVALDTDVIVVSDSIPLPERCERIAAMQEFGPISFQESSTVFRSSAYAVLDRIIALADACRSATVEITGHSDSTGDAIFNQQLSVARAQAVADFVADRGIAPVRLVARGAGAANPIADNSTRYGRSLNRRIDIDFTVAANGTAREDR